MVEEAEAIPTLEMDGTCHDVSLRHQPLLVDTLRTVETSRAIRSMYTYLALIKMCAFHKLVWLMHNIA